MHPNDEVRDLLFAFVERTSDLVGVVDEESRVVYLNEAARKRLGVGETAELTTVDIFPPDAFTTYYDEVRPALLRSGTWRGELPVLSGSGEAVPMQMTIVARTGPGGEVTGLVTHGREVAPAPPAAPSAGARDELTGLPGRAIFDDRLRIALSHSERDARRLAVIVVDVDDLKDVNDSFGHAVGDEVLLGLAHRLSRNVRRGDTVARFGGDEFVVLVDGLDEAETVVDFVERMRGALSQIPIATAAGSLVVSASFGVADGDPALSPAELLERADTAMYRAKASGGDTVAHFADHEGVSPTTLADELAVAVSHGLIRPHVQSVVDLNRGVLVGYQGLARWDHPVRGLLEAERFVDVVVNTPVMPVVDLAVLRRTAAAAARTARGGLRVRAYGHLSRRLVGDVGLARYLTEIVQELRIPAGDLCLEIGYASVARPSRRIESALRDLSEIGVRTVLSDFDGVCDVNRMVEHGFDELRVARRLVRDFLRDPSRRRVAEGTIALARALGLSVIAVGIETEAERVAMRDAGCDYGQGRLFGPVQPAGTIS